MKKLLNILFALVIVFALALSCNSDSDMEPINLDNPEKVELKDLKMTDGDEGDTGVIIG